MRCNRRSLPRSTASPLRMPPPSSDIVAMPIPTNLRYAVTSALGGTANHRVLVAACRGKTLLDQGGHVRASSMEGVDDLPIGLLGKGFHGRRSNIPELTQHQH